MLNPILISSSTLLTQLNALEILNIRFIRSNSVSDKDESSGLHLTIPFVEVWLSVIEFCQIDFKIDFLFKNSRNILSSCKTIRGGIPLILPAIDWSLCNSRSELFKLLMKKIACKYPFLWLYSYN